jgi:hypothetical protein
MLVASHACTLPGPHTSRHSRAAPQAAVAAAAASRRPVVCVEPMLLEAAAGSRLLLHRQHSQLSRQLQMWRSPCSSNTRSCWMWPTRCGSSCQQHLQSVATVAMTQWLPLRQQPWPVATAGLAKAAPAASRCVLHWQRRQRSQLVVKQGPCSAATHQLPAPSMMGSQVV